MEITPILLDIRHTSPPDGILFDTDFFFSAIIPQEQYHNEAKTFLQEIIDNGTVVVYSSLMELEFWTACLKLEVETQEQIPRNQATRYLQRNPSSLKKYVNKCAKHMRKFEENMSNVKAMGVRMADVVADLNSMRKAALYNLYSYDTLHVASMFHCELENIATLDNHIRNKCAGINIYTIINENS